MTKAICPCCGRYSEKFEPLETLRLPRRERAILEYLMENERKFVSPSRLADATYAEETDGGPLQADNCIMSHVSKLRRKLKNLGWTIEGRRFEGYRLCQLEAA